MDRDRITHLSIALQKYRLKDAFGLDAVSAVQAKKLQQEMAASPLYLRKSSAFPDESTTCNAAMPPIPEAAAQPQDYLENVTEKQSFSANRRAEPEGLTLKSVYRIIGEPEDVESAKQLATEDPCQFQWWAVVGFLGNNHGTNEKTRNRSEQFAL